MASDNRLSRGSDAESRNTIPRRVDDDAVFHFQRKAVGRIVGDTAGAEAGIVGGRTGDLIGDPRRGLSGLHRGRGRKRFCRGEPPDI